MVETSKATGTVIINDTETVISYKVGTGVFVVNERIYGTKIVNGVVTETGATATITTVDTDVYIQQQGAYDMLATDHIILEPATVYSDGYTRQIKSHKNLVEMWGMLPMQLLQK